MNDIVLANCLWGLVHKKLGTRGLSGIMITYPWFMIAILYCSFFFVYL
jgi:hypothetical protein